MQLVPGVAVSGTVRWSLSDGSVIAKVTARTPEGTKGDFRLSWSLRAVHAEAKLTGEVGGWRLSASMPAP